MSATHASNTRRANLKRVLNPRHIAFVGGRHVERCIAMCRDSGFEGRITAVNPKYERLADIVCSPSLDALDEAPDAAFLALSRERSIEAIAKLAAIGAGGAVCHAAGFGELGGEYREAQLKLSEVSGEMAIIGPNCMGVINRFDRVSMWGEYNPVAPLDGDGVALISQSGAFLYGIVSVERAYPMGYAISVGNQAVIDSADLIDAALDDERVRVIGLYMEGLTNGAKLTASLTRALSQSIPVVLLRGGGTPASAERSMSHTGNLAVPNDFWKALIERYALIEVSSPKQLVETTKLVAVAGIPRGPRFFVATYSGAAATLLAEQAPQRGLTLPPVAAATAEKVRPSLPPVVTISNPLDFNLPWLADAEVSLDNAESMANCLDELGRDEADVLAMMFDVPRRETGGDTPWLPTIETLLLLRQRMDIPVVAGALLPEGLEAHLRERLLAGGVAPLCGFSETLDALGQVTGYGPRRRQRAEESQPLWYARQPVRAAALDEWEGKVALSARGLVVPRGWAGPASEAAAAASDIGFPVVLKVLSTTLLHKSRVGGVRLGLRDVSELETALRQMRDDLDRAAPGHGLASVLVEEMIEGAAIEIIVGVKRHPELGLALVVGRGGVDVEQLRDYRLVLMPAGPGTISRVLRDLGLTGETKLCANLIRAIESVQSFAQGELDRLVELDLNPILLLDDGRVVAADALVVLGEAAT